MPQSSPAPELIALWTHWLSESERQWNTFFNTTMSTPDFAEQLGQGLAAYLDLARAGEQLGAPALMAANLPTRTDLQELNDRLITLDGRLVQIEIELVEVARKRSAQADPTSLHNERDAEVESTASEPSERWRESRPHRFRYPQVGRRVGASSTLAGIVTALIAAALVLSGGGGGSPEAAADGGAGIRDSTPTATSTAGPREAELEASVASGASPRSGPDPQSLDGSGLRDETPIGAASPRDPDPAASIAANALPQAESADPSPDGGESGVEDSSGPGGAAAVATPIERDDSGAVNSKDGERVVERLVYSGETLEAIAAAFGTTVEAIAEENQIVDVQTVQAGAVLRVPLPEEAVIWIVAEGETLAHLAAVFETSVDALLETNGLGDANLLGIGQRLTILPRSD